MNSKFPSDWPQTQLGDAIALEVWYQETNHGLTRAGWLCWLLRLADACGEKDFRNLA